MPLWSSTYPAGLDNFTGIPQVDNVDICFANHPNTLAASIEAIQAKLGITAGVATGFGGISLDVAGKASNPGAGTNPTIWVDNSVGPALVLTYTDNLGVNWTIGGSGIGTLDDGYNQYGSNAADVIIDNAQGQGDLIFKPTDENSFRVYIENASVGEGFEVYDDTDYFRLYKSSGPSSINWTAELKTGDLNFSDTFELDVGDTIDIIADEEFTLTSSNSTMALNSDSTMILTAGSYAHIKSDVAIALLLTDAFSIAGEAAISAGTDGSGELTASSGEQYWLGVFPQINQTGTAGYDALHIEVSEDATGSGEKNLLWAGVASGGPAAEKFKIDNTGKLGDEYLSNPIGLSQSGTTGLSGFTATSLVGALNELKSGLGGPNMDQTYDNFGGPGTVTIDAGDLTFALTEARSFVVDVSAVTGVTNDGFSVVSHTDYFTLFETLSHGLTLSTQMEIFGITTSDNVGIDCGDDFLMEVHGDWRCDFDGFIEFEQDADYTGVTWFDIYTNNSYGLTASSGVQNFVKIKPIIKQTGTADYRALKIDVVETTTGSGTHDLIWAGLSDVVAFRLDSSGNMEFTDGATLGSTNNGRMYITPHGTGYTTIGTGSPTQSFTNPGDLFVANSLEVGSSSYFYNDLFLQHNQAYFGPSASYPQMSGDGSGGLIIQQNTDLSSGNFMSIQSTAAAELNSSSTEQSFVRITSEIEQSSTAAYNALAVNSIETSLGDGSSGDGNNLLWLGVGGSVMHRVDNSGNLHIDTHNIETDTSTGSQIATAASQKLGFFGATPIVQLPKASYNDWAAFTDVVDALVAIGLFDAA